MNWSNENYVGIRIHCLDSQDDIDTDIRPECWYKWPKLDDNHQLRRHIHRIRYTCHWRPSTDGCIRADNRIDTIQLSWHKPYWHHTDGLLDRPPSRIHWCLSRKNVKNLIIKHNQTKLWQAGIHMLCHAPDWNNLKSCQSSKTSSPIHSKSVSKSQIG